MGTFLLGRWSSLVFPKVVYLGHSCSLPVLTIFQLALGRTCACLQMTARFTGLFTMKTTRSNFNVTSARYRNGVKFGNFVFTMTNVRFYVLPMREIILAILISSLVVRFSLSPKRSREQGSLFSSVQGLGYTHSGICCSSLVTLFTEEH